MSDQTEEKGSVLLVDDDKFLLDMYVMKFQQAGFAVHGSLSGSDALKVLHDGLTPDAIVFDLLMPEMSGFSLLEALGSEKNAKGALKIALTNEMSDEEQQRVMQLGGDRYIVKATMIPSEVVKSIVAEIEKRKK